MKRQFLIHYGEIGIKGGNRRSFENRLVSNIRETFSGLPVGEISRRTGYLTLDPASADPREIISRLKGVAGIEFFLDAMAVEPKFESLATAARELFKDYRGSFRVTAKRADKSFPMTSQETAAQLGAEILKSNEDTRVDLHEPQRTCFVEIDRGAAWISADKIRGLGGLPVGSGGKLLSLISGGIDSPVSSWMMLRRGATLHYLHFHNFPYTDRKSIDIVEEAIRRLNRTGLSAALTLVNLTPTQEEIAAKCDASYRVVLYRRLMFRVAERIALREGAGGLVTGESLGQVASQTVENMRAIEAVTRLPVLRPLIGTNKEEIVGLAKGIDTYELSIRPHSDCCSLFVPDHPVTKASEKFAEAQEAKLDVEGLIKAALDTAERREINERAF